MACGTGQEPRGLGTVVLTAVSIPADSTGTHSLYTTYQDYEIMFHVSTLLPYTPNNRQQVSEPQLGAVSLKAFILLKTGGHQPGRLPSDGPRGGGPGSPRHRLM